MSEPSNNAPARETTIEQDQKFSCYLALTSISIAHLYSAPSTGEALDSFYEFLTLAPRMMLYFTGLACVLYFFSLAKAAQLSIMSNGSLKLPATVELFSIMVDILIAHGLLKSFERSAPDQLIHTFAIAVLSHSYNAVRHNNLHKHKPFHEYILLPTYFLRYCYQLDVCNAALTYFTITFEVTTWTSIFYLFAKVTPPEWTGKEGQHLFQDIPNSTLSPLRGAQLIIEDVCSEVVPILAMVIMIAFVVIFASIRFPSLQRLLV